MSSNLTLVVPEGTGHGIANVVRQIAMGTLKTWRPVCMGFVGSSNIISSPLTVQDMTEIYSVISSARFKPVHPISSEFFTMNYTFSGEFKLSDLDRETPDFHVTYEEDAVIATTFEQSVTLTVVYLLNSGNRSDKENQSFIKLNDFPVNIDRLVTYSSRHVPSENFGYTIEPRREAFSKRESVISFNITSEVMAPSEILLQTFEYLEQTFKDFKSKVE